MVDKLLSEVTPADIEVARKTLEDILIEWRDARLSILRNNGLVIREYDGRDSSIIRLGTDDAVRIGIQAIIAKGA